MTAAMFSLMPSEVAHLVDAFDRDERGVHVHRDESEIGKLPIVRHPGEIERVLGAVGSR
ncbi:MAG: hypothetical protein RML56_04955 [Burkholderiales bacterium]|nr:hypothetical protein [Burkholderiales bacterium]